MCVCVCVCVCVFIPLDVSLGLGKERTISIAYFGNLKMDPAALLFFDSKVDVYSNFCSFQRIIVNWLQTCLAAVWTQFADVILRIKW